VNGLLSAYVLLNYFVTHSLTCNLHFISFCRGSSHFLHNWSCSFQLFCLRFRRSKKGTGKERWHCIHSQCYSWPQSTWQSTVWRARSAGREVLYCLLLRSVIIITTTAIVQAFEVHNHYISSYLIFKCSSNVFIGLVWWNTLFKELTVLQWKDYCRSLKTAVVCMLWFSKFAVLWCLFVGSWCVSCSRRYLRVWRHPYHILLLSKQLRADSIQSASWLHSAISWRQRRTWGHQFHQPNALNINRCTYNVDCGVVKMTAS